MTKSRLFFAFITFSFTIFPLTVACASKGTTDTTVTDKNTEAVSPISDDEKTQTKENTITETPPTDNSSQTYAENDDVDFEYEKEQKPLFPTDEFSEKYSENQNNLKPDSPTADFIHDKTIADKSLDVIIAPDVSDQMLTPEYWLEKTNEPYKVLMNREEIARWNEDILESRFSPTEYYRIVTDIRKYGRRFDTQQIRDEMLRYRPGVIWYTKTDNDKVHRLTREDWLDFYDKMNYEPLGTKEYYAYTTAYHYPEKLNYYPIRKGICIKRSTIRNIPVETFYSDDPQFWFDDVNQISGILMNEPVLVLWESKDKQWYLIQSYYSAGWIRQSDIALCSDAEFTKYFDYTKRDSPDFITVTADQFTLPKENIFSSENEAPSSTFAEESPLFMGTYLNLADWKNINLREQFADRVPHSCYLAELPYKKADGTLGKYYAAVPAGICCKGLMPYTKANTINLAFKSLGKRYGWGGMENERDCTGYTKDLYRCFGFNFGKNSAAQAAMPGKTVYFKNLSRSQKAAILDTLEAGTLLYYYGHVFVYLGKADDVPSSSATDGSNYYAISSMGSYYPDGKSINTKTNACSVTVNNLSLVKKDGSTWLESLVCAKLFKLD